MRIFKIYPLFIFIAIVACLNSCSKEFKSGDYRAYFGGEVKNPSDRFVYFLKDNQIIDTIPLQENNTFFVEFDSLAPGMYTFKHDPEYQYVYFEKNDSIMVHINTKDFDESIIFCGRGDSKNNYMMESFLKNETQKEEMFNLYDKEIKEFTSSIDSTLKSNKKNYNIYKNEIKWSNGFDEFAKAELYFNYFSKKELYPIIHNLRTAEGVFDKLPANYYSYRKNIDFDNVLLSTYSPFVIYLSNMLNNVGAVKYHNHFSVIDLALTINLNKLKIADTLIKNEKVKNSILNNIAFSYLLEDQNIVNNQKFQNAYRKYSTDISKKNEILKIGNSIQLLTTGNELPAVNLINKDGIEVSSDLIFKKKSVLFFYTKEALTHMAAAHKKAIFFKKKYPNYQFIAINLDKDQKEWIRLLSTYKFGGIEQYRCANFEDIKNKLAITKIHRTLVLNPNGKVKNAFTNLFDIKFESDLK